MSKNLLREAVFEASSTFDLPPERGPEVAFAGRSNAGKSTTLNTLCDQNGLARTSKTPGRTQAVNFFSLPKDRYLVDLPGYGFAKVPPAMKEQWRQFIEDYVTNRTVLNGIVVLMDARRPLTPDDRTMVEWTSGGGLPTHVLLNKCDKLKPKEKERTLEKAQRDLAEIGDQITVQLFANGKRPKAEGLIELRRQVNRWLYA